MKDVRVVLVEDDDVDIMAMRRALNASDVPFTLSIVRDGIEALQCLRKEAQLPHLVFLDLNMPRMGGLEVLDELRKEGPTVANVIVLSTSGASIDREEAIARGAAGYVVKSNFMGDFRGFTEMISSFMHSAAEVPSNARIRCASRRGSDRPSDH